MALLDRLRPQPAWKHADPAVRIASLDTLPESELGVIATLARTDESPRVRRAAIARLTDADALGMIARGDVDTQVRADALARLLTLALDGTDIPRAALAARALREERALVQVARSAPDAEIALAALDRLSEARAFGAVAKHSMHDAVRARALERLTDPAELEAVAITTENNDTGVAAVDRLGESAAMDVIADRARNPVVARRARAFIRVRDQRAADARAKAEAGARRRALLTEGVDALEHVSDPARARAELDRLEAEFAALADDAGGADDAARFAGRIAVQRARLDALEQAEAAAAAERAARAAGIEAREALIARAAEDAGDLDAHLAGLLSEWSALSSLAGGDDGSWTRRFAETGEQARSRAAARARAAAVHDDVVALVGRIEALVAPDAALEESERAWPVLESEWKALTAPLEIDAELSARVRRVADMFAERRRSRQADAAKVRDHRLETWKALAARAGAVRGPARRADARRRSGRPRPEGGARAAGRWQRRRRIGQGRAARRDRRRAADVDGRPLDAAARAARRRRLAPLGERRHPGGARQPGRGPEVVEGSSRTSPASCATCGGSGRPSASGATSPARCGSASRAPPTSCRRAATSRRGWSRRSRPSTCRRAWRCASPPRPWPSPPTG